MLAVAFLVFVHTPLLYNVQCKCTNVRNDQATVILPDSLLHDVCMSTGSDALQIHCTENSKQIYPEMKLHGIVLNVCIRFVYSHDLSANTILQNRQTDGWEFINRSGMHECRN